MRCRREQRFPRAAAARQALRPHRRTHQAQAGLSDRALVKTDAELATEGFRTPEESAIAELCTESRSVAEVAALIKLPLGVVRVLIADLADRGVVEVHAATYGDADSRPDASLLERVLSGLRNL